VSRGPGRLQREVVRILEENEEARSRAPRMSWGSDEPPVPYFEDDEGRRGRWSAGMYPATLAGMIFGEYTRAQYEAVRRACWTAARRNLISAWFPGIAKMGVPAFTAKTILAPGYMLSERYLPRVGFLPAGHYSPSLSDGSKPASLTANTYRPRCTAETDRRYQCRNRVTDGGTLCTFHRRSMRALPEGPRVTPPKLVGSGLG